MDIGLSRRNTWLTEAGQNGGVGRRCWRVEAIEVK